MDVKTGVGAAYFCHQYTTDEKGIYHLSLFRFNGHFPGEPGLANVN